MHHRYYIDPSGNMAVIYRRGRGKPPYMFVCFFGGKAVEIGADSLADAHRLLAARGSGWREMPIVSSEDALADSCIQ